MMLPTEKDALMTSELIKMLMTAIWDDGFFIAHQKGLEDLAHTINSKAQDMDEGKEHD